MKSAPFKKVFENNVDEKETFAESNTDVDKQMAKTLEGPNRAFFHSKARMLTQDEYKCKVMVKARFIWNAEISICVAIHCYERLF